MATFRRYKPKSEKELHSIIEKDLDSLEEGLELLKYEMGVGRGIPDFLCVDSGGRLVIIEVKLYEDENILFQALRYYSEIDKNRYAIAQMFKNKNIDPTEHPRVILIAERFSDEVKRLATLVVPEIELYEYDVIEDSNDNIGIIFHQVSLPIDTSLTEPVSIKDHIEYITKDGLKPILEEIREKIRNIGKGIEEYATQYYIGFKYKGRLIAGIYTYRKYFDLWVNKTDEERNLLYWVRIENGNEDYSNVLEKIKEYYKELGGKL